MTELFVDRITAIVFQNGILRVECSISGPNNEERPVGTLLVPAAQVGAFVSTLVGGTQELDKRLRETAEQAQAAQTMPAVGNA